VEADIFVFDHDPARGKQARDIKILGLVVGRNGKACSQVFLRIVLDKIDAGCGADIHTGIAFYAQREGENGLHIAI
jgi:hypothetical protein